MKTLAVNEIFYSIQGESTWAGLRCVFVRLMGCHLRCGYCDTEYAFYEGEKMGLDEIISRVKEIGDTCKLVEVTGGEPLLQKNVHELMTRLADEGYEVLLETSGACDVSTCDERVRRIMDLKTPGSGEVERNLYSNIENLNERDEVKFVLTSREDYEWAREVIHKHNLVKRAGAVLVSAVQKVEQGKEIEGTEPMDMRDLAEWVMKDGLEVRLQTQLHKLIWDPSTRGV